MALDRQPRNCHLANEVGAGQSNEQPLLIASACHSEAQRLTNSINGDTYTKDNKDQEDQIWFLAHRCLSASTLPINICKVNTI